MGKVKKILGKWKSWGWNWWCLQETGESPLALLEKNGFLKQLALSREDGKVRQPWKREGWAWESQAGTAPNRLCLARCWAGAHQCLCYNSAAGSKPDSCCTWGTRFGDSCPQGLLCCRNSTTNNCRVSPSTLDSARVIATDEMQRWFILQTSVRSLVGRLQIHQQGWHHSVMGQHAPATDSLLSYLCQRPFFLGIFKTSTNSDISSICRSQPLIGKAKTKISKILEEAGTLPIPFRHYKGNTTGCIKSVKVLTVCKHPALNPAQTNLGGYYCLCHLP